MSQLKTKSFQLSTLAAAILSLSACSSTPHIGGVDLGSVGSGIGKVGSKTAELGANAWEGTKNFLNIGPQDEEMLDEVDLALMEDDAGVEVLPVASNEVDQLLPVDPDNQALLPEGTANTAALVFGEIPADTNNGEQIVTLAENPQQNTLGESNDVLAASAPATVPVIDLEHTVAKNETLWDIAKSTTGDANNWHVIADINNLAPNASVSIGQTLIIPADMVKPDYNTVDAPTVAIVAEADTSGTVQNANESAAVALNIPAQDSQSVVAAAEQIKPMTLGDPADMMTDATALKVDAGETLWDFAKRTTGDATNWKQIASKNLLDEAMIGKIRPGQKIYVPTDMVRQRDENGVLIAKAGDGVVPTANAGALTPENQQAIDASAAVLAGTNTPGEGEIKIVEAAYQDTTGIKPVTESSLAEEVAVAVVTDVPQEGQVMIKGTYYPKAVYNEADFSSSLLMRVSPGTQLTVSKAIGPWLEVTTDKGVGYVHSRDIK